VAAEGEGHTAGQRVLRMMQREPTVARSLLHLVLGMACSVVAGFAAVNAQDFRPAMPADRPSGPILKTSASENPPATPPPGKLRMPEDPAPAPPLIGTDAQRIMSIPGVPEPPQFPPANAQADAPRAQALPKSLPATPIPDARITKPTASIPPEANVSLEMVGPDTTAVGVPASYEIIVRNQSKSPVFQVRVENELPSGIRFVRGEPTPDIPADRLVWNLGILDGGMEKRLKFTIVSSTEGEIPAKATVSFAASCSVRTKFTRPKLSLTITGPETVAIGEPVVFQIQLANIGTGPISRIVLRNKVPSGLQHPQGSMIEAELPGLAVGESKVITLRTLAIKGGPQCNEIEALAESNGAPIQLTGGTRSPDLSVSAKAEVRVLQPDLAVKITGPKSCLVKCDGIFTIDVTNPGSGPINNVRIVNRLPEGMDFLAASDEGRYDPVTKTISWNIVRLDPAAHRVVTFQLRGTVTTESTNVVMAQADGNLIARAELPVHVEGVPAISLEVVALDDPVAVNSDASYEIRVLNRGSCPCTGIQIIASLPEGMELREVQAPVPYQTAGQQLQFAPYAKLATKADIIYRVKVRSRVPGDVRFRVQLTCDQLQQPVFKEESSRFYKQ